MEPLLMVIAGFVVGVIIALLLILLKCIFSPILIAFYALFYRKNLLYKQRFALLFYKFRIVNLIIYIIDTLALIFTITNNPATLNHRDIKTSIVLSCIVIPLYIFLYIKSKTIIQRDQLLIKKEKIENN